MTKKLQRKKESCFWYRSFQKTRKKDLKSFGLDKLLRGGGEGEFCGCKVEKGDFQERMQYSGPDNAWAKETIVSERKGSESHFFLILQAHCNKNLVTLFPFIISYFEVFQAF